MTGETHGHFLMWNMKNMRCNGAGKLITLLPMVFTESTSDTFRKSEVVRIINWARG